MEILYQQNARRTKLPDHREHPVFPFKTFAADLLISINELLMWSRRPSLLISIINLLILIINLLISIIHLLISVKRLLISLNELLISINVFIYINKCFD